MNPKLEWTIITILVLILIGAMIRVKSVKYQNLNYIEACMASKVGTVCNSKGT